MQLQYNPDLPRSFGKGKSRGKSGVCGKSGFACVHYAC